MTEEIKKEIQSIINENKNIEHLINIIIGHKREYLSQGLCPQGLYGVFPSDVKETADCDKKTCHACKEEYLAKYKKMMIEKYEVKQ